MAQSTDCEEVYNPLSDDVIIEEGGEEKLKTSALIPEKTANSNRKRRKFILYFLVIVFLSSVIDILVFSLGDKQFAVEESRLVLESESADAELVMSAHVKLNSLFHSFNVNDGHCQYFYTQEDSSAKMQVVDIYGYFDHDHEASKAQNEVKILFQLHNTDYTQLRHLLWAYHTGSKVTTSVECSALVTVNAFKLFPIQMNIQSANINNNLLDNEVTFQDNFSLEKEDNEQPSMLQLLKKMKQFVERTFTLEDVSASSIVIQAANTINTINSLDSSPFPVKSLIIEMPQLSYSINSVAHVSPDEADTFSDTDTGSDTGANTDTRIIISNTPLAVELGEAAGGDTTAFSTMISATCSQVDRAGELTAEPEAETEEETGIETGGHCSLFTALHIGSFIDEISKGHMHIHADSNRPNFVSSLLGQSHFVSAQKFDPVAATTTGGATGGRALADMLSPRDPDVSNGASCLVVDGDSVVDSVVCYEVDKGFMTTYLDVYDGDGSMAVIKGSTAWNVGGGFAFDGQYVVVARGGYLVVANMTASEDFKNASAVMSYNQNDEELLHGNIFTAWDTWTAADGLPAADVQYWLQFDENFGTPGRFNSTGELSFGDNTYEFKTIQDSSLNAAGDWVGVGSATGQYEGGLWDWQLTVDSSQYAVDSVVKGSMTGLLSSSLDTDGAVVVQANVLDSNEDELVDTVTNIVWSSQSSWSVEGAVDVDSLFTSDFIDWDNYNSLTYQDKAYVMRLQHFDQDRFERMYASADGSCGGVVTQFHFSVDNSELWLDEVKKGTMAMLFSSEVNMPGTVGDLRLDVEVLNGSGGGSGGGAVLLSTQNRAQWDTPLDDEWTTAGNVQYLTMMDIPDTENSDDSDGYSLTWNSDGYFQYANNVYETRLATYKYASGDDVTVVFAEGAYQGQLYDWQVSVEHSELYEYEDLVGTMTGGMSSRIYDAGKGADITVLAVVKDASANEWMVTDSALTWEGYGADSSWGSGGRVALESEFSYDEEDSDTLSWHVIDTFQFADHLYDFQLLSLDRQAEMRWAVNGDGVYHGEVQDFSITLEYSELVLSGDLFGTAEGEVRARIPGSGTNGEVYFSSAASDANNIEIMGTTNTAVWHTVNNWGSQGVVDFNSSFYFDSCADCATVVAWHVKEHFVHDDGNYGFFILNEKTNGDDLFWVSAAGKYGGKWVDWWLSLEESDLVIDDKDYGAATGFLSAEVRDGGEFADIFLDIQAVNDQDAEVMFLNMTAEWSTNSVWSESGHVDYSIALQIVDTAGESYLSPPFVVYGSDSNQANYQSSHIYMCPWDTVEVSLCDSTATCYQDTYLSLFQDNVQLAYNDDYCGSCANVYYFASNLTECVDVEVRYGCFGDNVCSGSAAIYQQSFRPGEKKPMSYFLDFNRYRKLSYGDNKYSHETRLYESNGQEHVYNLAQGTYGGQLLDWFFSVDYAELRYEGVKQGDVSLTLTSQTPYDGAKADLTGTMLSHVPSSTTGVDEEQVQTTNIISWDGHDASHFITAHVYTDTLFSTEPQFFLETALDIDNVAKKAEFFLLDSVSGAEQANVNATAWYSTQTGMMTGIDMTVRYQESPLFSANMFLNTQTQTLSQPSGMPSGEPSRVRTVQPTGAASGVPSAVPSRQPISTSYPTNSPTIFIPVVTVVSFSTLAQLAGITAEDMDLPAQEAFLDVTADSMTGVDASDLVITGMDTVVVRHLRSAKRRLSSAVDIIFTTTTNLEESGYSSATALAEGLESEVTVAYADPATATAFTAEAEALGSTTVDSTTEVVFEEPVLDDSSITEDVVRTSAPTVTAAVKSSSEDDDGEITVLMIALLVPIFAIAIIAAAGYVCYRHRNKDSSGDSATDDKTSVSPSATATAVSNPIIKEEGSYRS